MNNTTTTNTTQNNHINIATCTINTPNTKRLMLGMVKTRLDSTISKITPYGYDSYITVTREDGNIDILIELHIILKESCRPFSIYIGTRSITFRHHTNEPPTEEEKRVRKFIDDNINKTTLDEINFLGTLHFNVENTPLITL